MEKKVIILGTAHGDNVAGKCSPDGKFREFRYSREICEALRERLEARGYKVYIDIEQNTVPSKQSDELVLRANIVNNLCTKFGTLNCVYVSIHVNAAGSDGKWHGARGWSVYTSKGRTRADALATSIWNSAKSTLPLDHKTALRSDMSDGDPDYESNFYVLAHTKCPAVLTENLFQDNEEDVAYLTSAEGRNAIVTLHELGIINYINS